jgi:putative heme iron utilization protein
VAKEKKELIGRLLDEVVRLRDILFVMGKGPDAVMEAWVDPEETHLRIRQGWVAVESKLWHCHLELRQIAELRFVEEPDPHGPDRRAFSIRLLRNDDEPLLMIFFGRMYDEGGKLIAEKVERFRSLREEYGA